MFICEWLREYMIRVSSRKYSFCKQCFHCLNYYVDLFKFIIFYFFDFEIIFLSNMWLLFQDKKYGLNFTKNVWIPIIKYVINIIISSGSACQRGDYLGDKYIKSRRNYLIIFLVVVSVIYWRMREHQKNMAKFYKDD